MRVKRSVLGCAALLLLLFVSHAMSAVPIRFGKAVPTPASPAPVNRDAEAISNLSAEGQALYAQDDPKLDAERYCDQSIVLAEKGQFRESIRAASRVLFLGEQSRDENLVALAKRDLALAYNYAGDLDNAKLYAEQALAAKGSPQIIQAPAYKVLGDVSVRQGNLGQGIEYYQQALKVSSDKFKPLVQLSLANVYVQAGKFAEAQALYDSFPVVKAAYLEQFYLRGLGNLHLARGNTANALAVFIQSHNEARGPDTDYQRFWAQDGIGRTYLALDQQNDAAAAFATAADIADRSRSRFVSEEFKTGLFGDIQQVYDRAVESYMALGQYQNALDMSERSRSRALLDLVRGRVRSVSSALPPADTQTERLSGIQAGLDTGEVLIEFHSTEHALYAWVIRREEYAGFTIDVGRDALARQVEIAVLAGTRRGAEQASGQTASPPLPAQGKRGAEASEQTALPSRDLSSFERGFQLLIAPLGLRANERLIIVPHGPLHYLPFQALKGADGYLIQNHPIVIEPSATIAIHLLKKPNEVNAQGIVFGNPMRRDAPALNGAEREARAVSERFHSVELYVRDQATKKQFTQSAANNAVIHVAAHARVDKEDPLFSSILLASDGTDRGNLEAREIFNLNLSNVALATLSACSSGQGKILRGDEALGFTRSFLGAGVSSLIVSLWPVDDESTRKLMTQLYAVWSQSSDSIQIAMQNAQIRLLSDGEHQDPYYWAPFNLIGNWRQKMAP